MWKTENGSTGRLLQLCLGLFVFYIVTGVSVKFFLSTGVGRPNMNAMTYLLYGTASSTILATAVAIILKWYKMDSVKKIKCCGVTFPSEFLYIIPAGVCTAVIIPATTLMYSFTAISVMVAMVVMRGAVIIIGRIVDAIQIKQGILHKKVYKEANIAVAFALAAVGVKIFTGSGGKAHPFTSAPVMIIFGAYILSYGIRIYIMNYYKNTRPETKTKVDNNKAYFAIEQFASTTTIWLVGILLIIIAAKTGWAGDRITPFKNAFFHLAPGWWYWAMIWGTAFGVVAFFSVFLFMFKGRTATFAGLVNRLTSLIAGTVATLIFCFLFGGKAPNITDWIALALILIAIGFMAIAEKKRVRELGLVK